MEDKNEDKRKRDYGEYKKGNKGKLREVRCLGKCNKKVKLRYPFFMCPRCRSSSENIGLDDHAILY